VRPIGSFTRIDASRAVGRPSGLYVLFAILLSLGSGIAIGKLSAQEQQTAAPSTSIADLRALEHKMRATLERVSPCVVAVSGGSGVVVSEDGLVLTVAHVAQRAGRRVSLTFPDGRRVAGRTLGNDAGVDAGLIKITEDGEWPYVEMGTSDDLTGGQWCLALGYPVTFERGKLPAARIGRVLRNEPTTIVTDCTIMGGDSGGPLFDADGKVIGIGSRCDNRLTINIHVPVDCYRQFWERLVASEDFNSQTEDVAFLGVVPAEDTDTAEIAEVFEDSGAAKAGIAVGDVILRFDGTDVGRTDQLPRLIRKRRPGDEVEVEVRRGEKTLRLKVTLGSRDD
jgi:serine protease Do